MKDISEITHGLLVLDPTTLDGDDVDIVHFVGYWGPPTEHDIEEVKNEIATDEEFGLTAIAHRLIVVEAPDEVVEYYREILQQEAEDDLRRGNVDPDPGQSAEDELDS